MRVNRSEIICRSAGVIDKSSNCLPAAYVGLASQAATVPNREQRPQTFNTE